MLSSLVCSPCWVIPLFLFPLYSTVLAEDIRVVAAHQQALEMASRNETKCSNPVAFHCKDESKCLLPIGLCNGRKDCPLGDDENNCPQYCVPGYTKCTSDSKCIWHEKNCDGVEDCADGSDEKFCPSRLSIPWFWIGLAVLFLICIIVSITVGKTWCTKKNSRGRRPTPRPKTVQTVTTGKKNHLNVRIPDSNNVTRVLVSEEEVPR